MVTDASYQYKFSLEYSPLGGYGHYNWFLVADGRTTYDLSLRIANSGSTTARGSVFTLKARDGGIGFYDPASGVYEDRLVIRASSIAAGETPLRGSRHSAFLLHRRFLGRLHRQGHRDRHPGRPVRRLGLDPTRSPSASIGTRRSAWPSRVGARSGSAPRSPLSIITPEGLLIQPRAWEISSIRLPVRREAGARYLFAISGAADHVDEHIEVLALRRRGGRHPRRDHSGIDQRGQLAGRPGALLRQPPLHRLPRLGAERLPRARLRPRRPT